MLWHRKETGTPLSYTQLQKEKQRLSEIILHGSRSMDRWEAISELQDEDMCAELACKVQDEEDARRLINRIHNQLSLACIAANEKNETYIRLCALQWIYEPETLRIIAETKNDLVRSKAFLRIVESAKTTQYLKLLANDTSLPLYHRMMAALRLGEGRQILDLHGTAIYRESDIARLMIDKAAARSSLHHE